MSEAVGDIVRAYNDGREPERLAMKLAAMRSNVFSFYRGTAHLFWRRVDEARVSGKAPAAWCSNDLHLENFGTYVGDNGLVYFDVNDFDEGALSPCDWEVLRLVTSILVAAPSMNIGKVDAKKLASAAAVAYRDELAAGKARWIERATATGAIGALMGGLDKRDLSRQLDRRTVLKKGRRTLDLDTGKMLPIDKSERVDLERFTSAFGKATQRADFFHFVDAARRVAGTGSLGLSRYVLLVEGDGSPDGNVLLDLKIAVPSTAAPASKIIQPKWSSEAERVVAVQRAGQAVAPHYLDAVTFSGKPFVLKELQPSADRLDLARIAKDRERLIEVVQTMGRLAAWAQLRTSGRRGSATADDLIGYAEADITTSLLQTAQQMAVTTLDDYAAYSTDYDAHQATPADRQKKPASDDGE